MTIPPERLLDANRRIVRENPYGFLMTGTAQVHTRLVRHFTNEGSDDLWIGTSPRSRKCADVLKERRVVYAIEDRAQFAYAALYCDAQVIDDEETLRAHWSEGLGMFFPAGPTGGDFVLLRLVPSRIELMTFAERIHPEPVGLIPAVLVRRGDGWQVANAVRDD